MNIDHRRKVAIQNLPRRVEVHGHQQYYKGWFHGWRHERQGEYPGSSMRAVVEADGGTVNYEEPQKLTFLD